MSYPFTITGGTLGTDYTIGTGASTSQTLITFLTAGIKYTFTPTQTLSKGNYLVVGGGGQGGGETNNYFGGGGGGGEVIQDSNITFNSLEEYIIFVGEGGISGTIDQGNNGNSSYISSNTLSIDCSGGQGGFSFASTVTPGCGGKSYLSDGSYYSGGISAAFQNTACGGGAGNGGNGTGDIGFGGNGGIGVTSTITGISTYYGGGGGGGAMSQNINEQEGFFFGLGGLGGGGNGGQGLNPTSSPPSYPPTVGLPNSGGGGGGGTGFIYGGIGYFGAAGGSGIVILSFYSTSFYTTVDASTTSSYQTTTNLTDTAVNTGGIDVFGTGTLSSLVNNFTIFGGGGKGSLISGASTSGRNALQIESTATITSLVNKGSFCGGGGAGQRGGSGGAGGGGGGAVAPGVQYPGGNGGNGLFVAGDPGIANGTGGGGGGFGAAGGGTKDVTTGGYITGGGAGSIAGGGGGDGGNAGIYGASVSAFNYGGGGAGGGNGYSGGGGGSGGGYSVGGSFDGAPGGYGIYNLGKITTLENEQGIGNNLGALFYAGNLPTNYNIIIQSASSFGQLFYTGWYSRQFPSTNILNTFNISTLSSIPSSQISYDAVLVNIKPSKTSGTNWVLNYVPAGQTNCKGNIVTIGGVNYDSYDLIVNPSKYITLNSLVPSRSEIGKSININFTTNLSIALSNTVTVNFGTTKSTGTITKIVSNTATVSVTVPTGSGTVPVTITINSIISNSLNFSYTTSPSSNIVINFIGNNQITDSYNDLYAFALINSSNPTTSIQFTVTINNNTVYNNCVFKFNLTTPNVPTSLNSVQLSVTNNSKTYNLIYNPYINGNKNVQTYITYTLNGIINKVPFAYTYINGSNPWYFVKNSTSSDTSNVISYSKEGNFISATSTEPNPSSIVLQNIGTLGMCGASNAFINGPTSESQDIINASISWCFYCLYNITQQFTY